MSHIDNSRFIVFEGLEGAGKTTVMQAVADWFARLVPADEILFTREPGGTPVAEQIRRFLAEPHQEDPLTPEAELLLVYAARMQHVNTVIYPALQAGRWVICDRFTLSSFAYQGGGRRLGRDRLDGLNQLFLGDFCPGLTIFLDVSPQVGLGRIQTRGHTDRFEQETVHFFERARTAYRDKLREDPHAVCVDADRASNQVIDTVLTRLQAYCAFP